MVGVQEVLAGVDKETQGDGSDGEEREGETRGEGHRCRYPPAERAEDAEVVEVVTVSHFAVPRTVL